MLIVSASSLYHAFYQQPPDQQEKVKNKVYMLPGLSLNCRAINPKKVLQNLLETDLKGKTDIVIWHDVINNSLSKHKSNRNKPPKVPELLKVLEALKDKVSALVYCHRYHTPDIFDILSQQSIPVLNIVRDFTSDRKQKDPEYLHQLKVIHQSADIEWKHLNIVLRHESELQTITDKTRPKRPGKRARKALKSAAAPQPA